MGVKPCGFDKYVVSGVPIWEESNCLLGWGSAAGSRSDLDAGGHAPVGDAGRLLPGEAIEPGPRVSVIRLECCGLISENGIACRMPENGFEKTAFSENGLENRKGVPARNGLV